MAFVVCVWFENEMYEIDVQGDCCTRELGKIGAKRVGRLVSEGLVGNFICHSHFANSPVLTSRFDFLPNVDEPIKDVYLLTPRRVWLPPLSPGDRQFNG